jgi:tRNA A22 N-methylase
MPIRWNDDEMTELDVLHKNLQTNFMWSDYFINKGDLIMFNKCQNDINNIRFRIKEIKQQQQSKFQNKQNNLNTIKNVKYRN